MAYQYGQQPVHTQQYMQRYQNYGQQSQSYGGYGSYYQNAFAVAAWQAYQFQTPDDLQMVFAKVLTDSVVGRVINGLQAEDLQKVLNETPTIRQFYNNMHWSREMCSIMIAMLDRSTDGIMQWEEFLELQQCLVAWFNTFRQIDANNSGFIEPHELRNVITHSFRYNISPKVLETLLKRYSRLCLGPDNRPKPLIAFDDFVSVCVRLRAYTDAYRKRDAMINGRETGRCNFEYDDFLQCVMCL